MKYLFTLFIAAIIFLTPINALAINLGSDLAGKAAGTAGYGAATETTLAENIGNVIKIILSLTGVIFTGLMVYAGFLWMTAKGEESKVESAQEIIKAAIIGLVITLGAYSVTEFVVPKVLERLNGSTQTPPP